MQPALAILTTHFGTNFSGGSTATCEIFSRLEDEFSAIHVIGTELGDHSFRNIIWHPYRNTWQAIKQIQSLQAESVIFYGDFYNAFLFTLLKKSFYFTYHDNWPELRSTGWRNRLRNCYFWPQYRRIFTKAKHVITVSNKKMHQIKPFTNQVSLIRNGFNRDISVASNNQRKNVVMAGNIDTRKYQQAVELFETLPTDLHFEIHIYGHLHDQALAKKLNNFPFVTLKGHQPTVPYANYTLLLHTSQMENLSIVWCEALFQKTKVLTYDVGAANEVIDADGGWCIPPYDSATMKLRLLEYMKAPYPIKNTPAILDQYDWQMASEQYKKLIFPQSTT